MSKVKKKIAESSSFNLLGVYLTFIFGIFNTFLIARLLLPEEWAIVILSLSIVFIFTFFCNLFPPNAHETIQYYLPHLKSNEGDNTLEIRYFIYHVYKIRFLSTIIVLISLICFIFLANFNPKLSYIFFAISPSVVFYILKNLNNSILLAFQKFKRVFINNVINPLIVATCLIIIYIYQLKDPLVLVIYTYLLGAIISCIVSIFLIIHVIPFKSKDMKIKISFKKKFINIHKKYGIFLTMSEIFLQLSSLIIYLLFLNFDVIIFITYLTICEISVTSALLFSSSDPQSYISIFSEINYKKDPKTYEENFYKLNKFLMLFVCIIVGIMIFFIEIYITVIYSQRYLVVLIFIQIILFSAFSKIVVRNLFIITQSTEKTIINAKITFIQMIISILSAIFALLFFGFLTLILLLLVGSFLLPFIAVHLINKKSDLKLKSIIFFKPFFVFLLSFIIVFPFYYFVNFQIIPQIYLLNVFINNAIKFLLFTFVFYIILYYSRLITKQEFNQLIEIIPILRSKNKIIQKVKILIEKLLPSEKLK